LCAVSSSAIARSGPEATMRRGTRGQRDLGRRSTTCVELRKRGLRSVRRLVSGTCSTFFDDLAVVR
jgi:hypothetical protein